MAIISYRRHRFPPVVLQQAVGFYLRSALSYRDVEKPLAERGLDLSYESVRSWVVKFAPAISRALRRCRPTPSDRWHLDEMVVRIASNRPRLTSCAPTTPPSGILSGVCVKTIGPGTRIKWCDGVMRAI